MNIIAVDDEKLALELSEKAILEALPDSTLHSFETPSKALDYAMGNQVDVAFLDIEMGGMSGLELAKNLKDIYGKTNIVFVTGYSQYALESYKVKASEYLMKPVSRESVIDAMEHLRHPITPRISEWLYIQTFGNFEVFTKGEPIDFHLAKAKELLAYLVDRRGAMCSNNEIISVLWEDQIVTHSMKSNFRNLVSELTHTLKAKGVSDILIKRHNSLGIAPDRFSCDIYDFANSVPYAVNSYTGEYMAQYSWAEFSNAYLKSVNQIAE